MVRHTPKLVICLREGYGAKTFLSDLGAGLTVAVIFKYSAGDGGATTVIGVAHGWIYII